MVKEKKKKKKKKKKGEIHQGKKKNYRDKGITNKGFHLHYMGHHTEPDQRTIGLHITTYNI